MNSETLLARYNKAKVNADQFYSLYQKAYELCAPNRNNYDTSVAGDKSPNVYDSTGSLACNSFVNTFMNTVTPVHSRWVELKAGIKFAEKVVKELGIEGATQDDIDDIEFKANEALMKITTSLFSYLNGSNLYSELASFYYDAAIGTGAMLITRGDQRRGLGSPIQFRTINPYYLAIEEGAYGEICGVYRKINSKVRDAIVEWPDINGLDYTDEDECLDFIECTVFNNDTYKWEYYIINNTRIVVKRIYDTNPWVIFRYSVISGETWGRGPVLNALPDLLLLNAAEELSLRAALTSAYGVYTYIADDVINPNTAVIIPGGMIPVKRNAGPSGPSIQPLPGIGNVNHQLIIKSDLQNKIRKFFLDESLPSTNDPRMTATEVLERVRKIQRDFGAVFGRISYELLQPLIQRTLSILVDGGFINLPPEFDTVTPDILKLQIVSPVAKMQSLQDVEALMQTIQMLGSINPELIATQVKLDDLGSWLADKLGAPNKFFKSQAEMEEEALMMQQAQVQQEQMQMMQAQMAEEE